MKSVILPLLCLYISITCAGEFSLNFFSTRISVEHQAPFHQFFAEIEEDLPPLFKNNIHRPITIEFKVFNYNKMKLSCHWRNYGNYARLGPKGTIEVNEQLMFTILNQHMDRDEQNCTYREVLEAAIKKALLGHLYPQFYKIVTP